ncbi:MAG: T9SS type A sorting domain-containing protein [Bacteroidales bacterium]|nr:T9SS type A sorting domain-containing protein [Bacteroidales bacterium]
MRRIKNKALILSLIVLMAQSIVFAQVERNLVIFEIGTGTWCYNCQGAAWGAEDMLEMGHNIAVIEYHYDDEYQNEESLYRTGPDYYNINAYPTTYFDGVDSHIGGNALGTIYSTYVPFYDDRIADTSPFSLNIDCQYNEGVYQISATAEQHTNLDANLILHCVVTESNIQQTWFESDELDFVFRKMIPDQSGSSLDFNSGNIQNLTLVFDEQEDWVHENIEIVVFIQDAETKEVYQAEKHSFWELEHERAVNLTKIINPESSTCGNVVNPRILLKNSGSSDISSIKFEYSINEEVHTYLWEGLLRSDRGIEIDLPETSFTPVPNSEIQVNIIEVNGETEFDTESSSLSKGFSTPYYIDCSTLYIEARTDGYYGSYSFKIFNSQQEVVYSRDSYPAAWYTDTDTVHLDMEECYSFVMYDSYGDGMCPQGGGADDGYYKLKDANEEIFAEGCDIGFEEHVLFYMEDPNTGIEKLKAEDSFRIYPNPSSGFIYIESDNNDIRQLDLISLSGLVLKTINPSDTKLQSFDVSDIQKGIYLLRIQDDENTILKKIVLK